MNYKIFFLILSFSFIFIFNNQEITSTKYMLKRIFDYSPLIFYSSFYLASKNKTSLLDFLVNIWTLDSVTKKAKFIDNDFFHVATISSALANLKNKKFKEAFIFSLLESVSFINKNKREKKEFFSFSSILLAFELFCIKQAFSDSEKSDLKIE